MLGDLAKLYSAIQSAESDKEKQERETALDDAVAIHLRRQFDDPKYPKRQRSLGALKKGLAIFDKDPITLQTHLLKLGATRLSGEGDNEVWHLPKGADASPPRRIPWVPILGVVAVLGFFGIAGQDILAWTAGFVSPTPETDYRGCVAAAKDIFVEIMECKEQFNMRL